MSLFRASQPNKSLSVAKFVVSSRSSLVSLVTGLVFLATATNSYGQFFYSYGNFNSSVQDNLFSGLTLSIRDITSFKSFEY